MRLKTFNIKNFFVFCGCFFLVFGNTLLGADVWAQHNVLRGLGQGPEETGELLPTPENIELESNRRLFTDTEVKLLQKLDVRRLELERREQALRVREKLVDLAEKEISGRVEEMQALQKELTILMGNLSDKEEEELVQLAKIYEEMRASNAAVVLNKLDDTIVFDLFKRMKRKSTAKVMEVMDPVKARKISQMLAEKAQLPNF